MRKRLSLLLVAFALAAATFLQAQQPAPAPSIPPPVKPAPAEFLRAADEVLEEMSRILALPVKEPLKKTVRTPAEIRAYVVRQIETQQTPAKRAADQKALEKFGLIPKGFLLEKFLADLLTEQIAGLYDPKGNEFFIADWIGLAEQRMVMAHELVHALHDQHFGVDAWLDAAKPNDDAATARDAVLEGAAIGGMLDYLLRAQSLSIRELPELERFIRAQILGEIEKSPGLARAPLYLRDSLLFPYLAGTTFAQRFLRAHSGWSDFHKVFENPPVSTQQILHPDLYLAGIAPQPVALPEARRFLPPGWKELDQNVLGEFGTRAVLKQFLGEERAARLAAAWLGDRYAVYEHQKTRQVLLVWRLRLAAPEDAARFFGQYSELLELKYPVRRGLLRRPNFFSFASAEGGVFFRCVGSECLTLESGGRDVFEKLSRQIGWPAAPTAPQRPARSPEKSAAIAFHRAPPLAAWWP